MGEVIIIIQSIKGLPQEHRILGQEESQEDMISFTQRGNHIYKQKESWRE